MEQQHLDQENLEKLEKDIETQTSEPVEDAAQEELTKKDAAQEELTKKKEEELQEMKDKYLRLYSDFENFRRRTEKERRELISTASQQVITSLLPIVDDIDRARSASENGLGEGVELIFNKLVRVLESKGLKAMHCVGEAFDADLHEAITQIPSPSEEMKGKIVDEVEKGYYLGDKLIRVAKVVVGN